MIFNYVIPILILYRSVCGLSKDCDHVVVRLSRVAHRDGFHREVITDGSIKLGPDGITEQLLIVEKFPSGIFIDPFELESKSLHKFVSTNESINIEDPAYRSHSIEVYIYLSLREGRVSINLPIHLRYQRPKHCYTNSSSFYETVILPSPKIYISEKGNSCSTSVTFPCYVNSSDLCHWLPVRNEKDLSLSFKVPVGCIEHAVWVVSITSIVIIIMVMKVGYVVITKEKNKSE